MFLWHDENNQTWWWADRNDVTALFLPSRVKFCSLASVCGGTSKCWKLAHCSLWSVRWTLVTKETKENVLVTNSMKNCEQVSRLESYHLLKVLFFIIQFYSNKEKKGNRSPTSLFSENLKGTELHSRCILQAVVGASLHVSNSWADRNKICDADEPAALRPVRCAEVDVPAVSTLLSLTIRI